MKGNASTHTPNDKYRDGWERVYNKKGNSVSLFKQYKRKGLSEMRPYVRGEDLSKISVAEVDDPEKDMGMVARNPQNHMDQWYVARKYFEDNLEPA